MTADTAPTCPVCVVSTSEKAPAWRICDRCRTRTPWDRWAPMIDAAQAAGMFNAERVWVESTPATHPEIDAYGERLAAQGIRQPEYGRRLTAYAAALNTVTAPPPLPDDPGSLT